MRSSVWLWAAILAAGVGQAAAAAEVPEFTPKITDVTVFKDGHALVMARGQAKLSDGWCRTREVPAPILGTFWAFVAEKDCAVDFVKAGLAPAETTRPCLTLEEMIQANKGKRVTIAEQAAGPTPISHEGVLLGILQHEATREGLATRALPEERDRWGRYVAAPAEVREGRLEKHEALAPFVMIETAAGVTLIKRENIRSITFADKKPATATAESRTVRELRFHVATQGRPAEGEHEVGMVYLQRGIRWIPDYRIELLDEGKARLSLQATVINELADLADADLRLVVGVPSFLMKETLSPLALREAGLQLSSFFAPPVRGRRGPADVLSNVMQSQVAVAAEPRGAQAPGGPDLPAEGQKEDLFLYQRPRVTLKKGETAALKLLELTTPYEDVYTWEIPPLPPRELYQSADRGLQQQLASLLLAPRAMHKVRLTNTGNTPWTTGPATIFKGNTVLGQQLLTFTSAKNRVEVGITVATDVNTKKEDAEVRREPNVIINEHAHSRISLHGKLTVTNFKDRPISLCVRRTVFGTVTAASADGRIAIANAREEPALAGGADDYPWSWWPWPWWWHSVNPASEITWDATIPPGRSATFEYDWFYYFRH